VIICIGHEGIVVQVSLVCTPPPGENIYSSNYSSVQKILQKFISIAEILSEK
jgi:hypothetical protein